MGEEKEARRERQKLEISNCKSVVKRNRYGSSNFCVSVFKGCAVNRRVWSPPPPFCPPSFPSLPPTAILNNLLPSPGLLPCLPFWNYQGEVWLYAQASIKIRDVFFKKIKKTNRNKAACDCWAGVPLLRAGPGSLHSHDGMYRQLLFQEIPQTWPPGKGGVGDTRRWLENEESASFSTINMINMMLKMLFSKKAGLWRDSFCGVCISRRDVWDWVLGATGEVFLFKWWWQQYHLG